MQVWDVRSNQLVQHYSAHSGPVTNVTFHPSGDFLLSSSLDTTLKVYHSLLPTPAVLISPSRACFIHLIQPRTSETASVGGGRGKGVLLADSDNGKFGCTVDAMLH